MTLLKTLLTSLIVFSSIARAEESMKLQEFPVPPHMLKLLKAKYEGESYKEIFINAGVNLSESDSVIPPSGSGLIVATSNSNNLDAVGEIILDCITSTDLVSSYKEDKKYLTKYSWDFSHLFIGGHSMGKVKFKVDQSVTSVSNRETIYYRWSLTKQKVIELRDKSGKLVLKASLNGFNGKMQIENIPAKSTMKLLVSPIVLDPKNKKANKTK